jgi:catecholate siderophore receptor
VFNLEQVEVVKGPDSAYSGRGSGGGSINLTSKSPKADDFARLAGRRHRRICPRHGRPEPRDQRQRRGAPEPAGHPGQHPGPQAVDFDRWGIAPSIAFGLNGPTQVVASYYHLDGDHARLRHPAVHQGGRPAARLLGHPGGSTATPSTA